MPRDATARYIDRIDACENYVLSLTAATRMVRGFDRSEVSAHRHEIEVACYGLCHLLDSTAEDK